MTARLLLAALSMMLVAATPPPSPAQIFGALYRDVQMRSIFPDSKTFADLEPGQPAAAILAAYRRCECRTDAALRAFVRKHFFIPPPKIVLDHTPPGYVPKRNPIAQHIDALWPGLTRTLPRVDEGSSALSLPRPFIIPGGRFREIYYWDSWFSMLGLPLAGQQDLVEDMIANFGSLLDRYGRIPNGTRTYYLSRSQPPVFHLIAAMSKDPRTLAQRTRWLRIEHAFWMAGERGLRARTQSARVVRLTDGALLNRYWDDRDDPRDESYREDAEVAAATPGRNPRQLYRDLRAGAESGWDFSSRWLADGRTLATIRTTRIVPVDLNSLLHGLETSIATNCRTLRDVACANAFAARADARAKAIRTNLYNPAGYFADYDLDARRVIDRPTAAMTFPLFARIATPGQARATALALAPLVGSGGLATTPIRTGQQWDAPNGWAPLQWIAVQGLRNYREDALARRIADGWLATVSREYAESGKLMEKYDVAEQRPGGGGEYPLQDGFGWTNGVTRALLAERR